MEDVLKLLAAGSDVTPFTFPAGLLGGAGVSGLGNLDLALALQNGGIPSFLMGSFGSGGGGPLPLPQALALPSLELPKLLSLDVNLDGGPSARAMAAVAAAAAGDHDDDDDEEPSGSRGDTPPPRNGRAGQRQQQQQYQQYQQLPHQLLPFDGPAARHVLPPAAKRDLDQLQMMLPGGRHKRQAMTPDEGSEDQEAEAIAALMERQEAGARKPPPKKQQMMEASNSDGSGSDSGSGGGRSAPARNGKRTIANKDPAARVQVRQLKKRDLNREAQRRFRDRQKAALALLESTTQSQQREIEALRLTNKLLEEQYRVLMEQYKGLQLRFVALQMKTQGKP